MCQEREHAHAHDVTMGSYHGAEVCELIGLFILEKYRPVQRKHRQRKQRPVTCKSTRKLPTSSTLPSTYITVHSNLITESQMTNHSIVSTSAGNQATHTRF